MDWRTLSSGSSNASAARLYQSIARLLQEGRVAAAGGNPEGRGSVPFVPPDPEEEMRLGILGPPYLSRRPRPIIKAAPGSCRSGGVTPSCQRKISRPSSVTPPEGL